MADLLAFDAAVRCRKLPARTTTELGGGQGGGIGIAGGAPGINAVLESAGAWAVVVVSNFAAPISGAGVLRLHGG